MSESTMRTLTLSLLTLLLAVGISRAQYPYNPYGGYGGSGYGGGYGYGGYGGYGALLGSGGYPGGLPTYRPPVSPYLNLLNSGTNTGNAAVNYFNFVRPFTMGPGRGTMGGAGYGGYNALRGQYFPTLNQLDEDFPTQTPELSKKVETDKETIIPVQMSPTGHQAGFANTLGYFGPMMAAQGGIGSRGQTQQQPPRR
jgi:hypothetical protein